MGAESIVESHLQRLLDVARTAIDRGLNAHVAMSVTADAFPEPLREIRGSFVTLTVDTNLRGCIGTLYPKHSLVEDVASNAAAAAFRDPRFPPVTRSEASQLHIHISILSLLCELKFDNLGDLIDQLRPTHGLIIAHGDLRATYLPSVWDAIPAKREFVQQLRVKAGIAAATPTEELNAWVYTVQEIS